MNQAAEIRCYLNSLLLAENITEKFAVKEACLSIRSDGWFTLTAWTDTPDREFICGHGKSFSETLEDFTAKTEPRSTAAQRRRTEAARLLAEADAMEAAK